MKNDFSLPLKFAFYTEEQVNDELKSLYNSRFEYDALFSKSIIDSKNGIFNILGFVFLFSDFCSQEEYNKLSTQEDKRQKLVNYFVQAAFPVVDKIYNGSDKLAIYKLNKKENIFNFITSLNDFDKYLELDKTFNSDDIYCLHLFNGKCLPKIVMDIKKAPQIKISLH